jgi:hypothetical protein
VTVKLRRFARSAVIVVVAFVVIIQLGRRAFFWPPLHFRMAFYLIQRSSAVRDRVDDAVSRVLAAKPAAVRSVKKPRRHESSRLFQSGASGVRSFESAFSIAKLAIFSTAQGKCASLRLR